MSGPPFNYADVTFRVTIRGDGRADSYVLRPINPNTAVAWSPPAALDVQSPMYRTTVLLTTGSIGQGLSQGLPYAPSYIAIVPPIQSTNAKALQGAAGDTGIPLIPNEALIIALPNPLPSAWQMYFTVGAPEQVDFYLW